ncbi:MAG: flagellar hook-basal body complex protein FliE [Lachnospiraceae bacterium]|nr:flagellar hook-basal body complex protein FliE [Lachnospiraceae bacterium]
MDISSLYNVSSNAIKEAAKSSATADKTSGADTDLFGSIFNSAVSNLNSTNAYLSDAENEKIKLAMGETDNTHDLSIALQKASASLQYTVAVRDKFIEAYKEIIQMQI